MTLTPGAGGTGWAGMDRMNFPGKTQMQWLWENTNVFWTGFYLNHRYNATSSTWPAQYSWLTDSSNWDGDRWGLAPIALGRRQEDKAGSPSPATFFSEANGIKDADLACRLAYDCGLPLGSVLYLDYEDADWDSSVSEYISGWCNEVIVNNFAAAVYCSHRLAAKIGALGSVVSRIWVWHVGGSSPSVSASTRAFPEVDPNTAVAGDAGAPSVYAWQYCQNLPYAFGPGEPAIQTDFDIALSADPSTLVDVAFNVPATP